MSYILIAALLVAMLIAGGYFLSKGNHTAEHKRLSRYGGEQGQTMPFFAILIAIVLGVAWILARHATIYSAF